MAETFTIGSVFFFADVLMCLELCPFCCCCAGFFSHVYRRCCFCRLLSQVAPVVRCQAVAKGDDNAVVDRRAVMVAAAASVLAIAAPVFAAEEAKPKKSSKYGEYGNICAALPTGSKCHQP